MRESSLHSIKKKKGIKEIRQPSGKSGKLSKDGLIFKNNLLNSDMTSQRGTVRNKIKP